MCGSTLCGGHYARIWWIGIYMLGRALNTQKGHYVHICTIYCIYIHTNRNSISSEPKIILEIGNHLFKHIVWHIVNF